MRSTRAMNGAASRAGAGPWRTWRRVVLGALALGAFAAPAASSGCVAGFDPPSRVSGLRVFAVTVHKGGSAEVDGAPAPGGSYANPGDEVTLKLHYQDPLGDDGGGTPRPVTIFWVGGCENPIGDDYYGCYAQFAGLAEQFGGESPDPGTEPVDPSKIQWGTGEEFTLKLGEDLVDSREPPATGPHYGVAYVFFVACAGVPAFVTDEGTGEAGSFPIGCFEYGTDPFNPDPRQRLGADRFVAGYTQVYAFAADPESGLARTNANPVIEALELTQGDGQELEDPDGDGIPNVPRCALTEDDRRAVGCSAEDPFKTCTAYTLDVVVPADVAEDDPDAKEQAMKEVVWVNYFADQGDLDRGIKLVSDAVKGSLDKHSVKWIPPAEPGVVTLTAVVRDARGGAAVVQRTVQVD